MTVDYRRGGGGDDEGLTFDITVVGPEDAGKRILRFDCFKKMPHYHMGPSGKYPVHNMRDEGIEDPVLWSLEQLKTRFPAMVRKRGTTISPLGSIKRPSPIISAGLKRTYSRKYNQEENMPRVTLDLNKETDRQRVKGQWRIGPGLVPGEPNEGLVAQTLSTPARMADYDDSKWEVCNNIRQSISTGFTFAWYRIAVVIPAEIDGIALKDSRVLFETNVDNYGEVWIDGKIDRAGGAIAGINASQRVVVSDKAEPGRKHVIACLVANGPLAEPRGGVYMRHATLAFESRN